MSYVIQLPFLSSILVVEPDDVLSCPDDDQVARFDDNCTTALKGTRGQKLMQVQLKRTEIYVNLKQLKSLRIMFLLSHKGVHR